MRAMSPLDHVYAGLSFIKALRGSANPDPANATVRDLLQTCANGYLKARTSAVSKLFFEWNVLPHAKTTSTRSDWAASSKFCANLMEAIASRHLCQSARK